MHLGHQPKRMLTKGDTLKIDIAFIAKRLTFLTAVSLFGLSACAEKPLITQEELVRRTQAMLDGLDRGDQMLWKLYVAEDAMIFDEKGNDQDKKALLADIQPMPAGYTLALVVKNPKSRFGPNVAILSYDSEESETVYGQHLTARYHTTDTWLYRNHVWQIVADQTLRYYDDPARGSVSVANLKDYTGTYELSPGIQVTITQKGDELHVQRGSGAPSVLVPESPDLFFRHGVEGRRLFHRLPSGQVDALIERRNNEDLVWKKLP